MFFNNKTNQLTKSVRLALIYGSLSIALAPSAFAAEDDDEDEGQKITITGSAIKSTDIESSLPVQIITREDIVASGVTNIPDLIAQIPSMQGMLTAADSVGGGGGGVQTASLRDLGSAYTLVLVNGRRLAAIGSGSGVDLNSIPMAAVERIDILKDGASAIYGSDAIAGVVNFILKDDMQESNINIRFDKPYENGGRTKKFTFSTGFGDYDQDGYNLLMSLSHEGKEKLRSADRDFAKTGIIPFNFDGEDLVFLQGSPNAIPANAYLTFGTGDNATNRSFNPYREANGECATHNAPSGTTCLFDYTSTLEILPESERNNLFLNGNVKLDEDTRLFSNVSYSEFTSTPRIAPYPTGPFTLPLDSQIVQDNIIPHLTADEAANLTRVVGRWRALPGGNRTNEFKTDTLNIVAGIDGEYEDVSYDLAVSFAKSERNNTYITGYPIGESFLALLRSGTVNVFDTPENMSDEAKADVKATMYNGPWSTTETTTKAVEGKISMPLFEMGGGEVMFASGFDYRKHSYALSYSQANKDAIILFSRPSDEFDLSRDTYGIFGEFMVPISDQLEVTTSFRRDTIGKITNSLDVGEKVDTKSASDNTFKVNLAYRPNDDWLLRASVGTGFKAPSMRSIAEPRIEFGVTSGNYDCPFPDSDPLASKCHPDPIQYNMYRQGNPNLKPETSEQASAGFVYAPSQNFTFKVDWWQVNIEDQVGAVSESQIFDNPERYRELFTTRIDPGTGDDRLAIISAPVNVGKSNNEGIDWGFILKNDLSFGTLRTKFDSTYMITSEALVIGTEDEYQSSMNQYGQNQAVTFRNIFRLENSLESGDFIHRFNVSWRSGYKDQKHPGDSSILLASDLDTTYKKEVQLTIPSYALFDYSTTYSVNDDAKVTFGIKNLADKKPPLSLRDGGVGHQVGYDPRYTDSFGRTLFVSADYTF